jgi:hypothetical protein
MEGPLGLENRMGVEYKTLAKEKLNTNISCHY